MIKQVSTETLKALIENECHRKASEEMNAALVAYGYDEEIAKIMMEAGDFGGRLDIIMEVVAMEVFKAGVEFGITRPRVV